MGRTVAVMFFFGASSVVAGLELPAPTGPYSVGRVSFHWIDTSRTEALAPEPRGHRELIVWIWYPAAPDTGTPSTYLDGLRAVEKTLGPAMLRKEIGPAYDAIISGSVSTYSAENAEILAAESPFPVVVFSHGVPVSGVLYTAQLEDLASHGYVVVAIDHPYDAFAVVYPDGRVTPHSAFKWGMDETDPEHKFEKNRVEVGAADVRFVLDQLQRYNDEFGFGSKFYKQLDLERIGVVGHSWGARVVARACQLDDRIRACLNWGALTKGAPFYADSDGSAIDQPFLMISRRRDMPANPTEEDLTDRRMTREEYMAIFEHADGIWRGIKGGSAWVKVDRPSFGHNSFVDLAILNADPTTEKSGDALQDLIHIREYSRVFLDYQLREGEQSELFVHAPPGIIVQTYVPGAIPGLSQ